MHAVWHSLGHVLGYFFASTKSNDNTNIFEKSILYRNLRILLHMILLSPLNILK